MLRLATELTYLLTYLHVINMTGEAVLGRKVCTPDKQTERGYHNYWGSQQCEEAHIPPPDLFFVWCPLS